MYELTIETEFFTFSDLSVLLKDGMTYELNETGEEIIREIIKGSSLDQIVKKLLDKFDANERKILKDVEKFFQFLLEKGLIDKNVE